MTGNMWIDVFQELQAAELEARYHKTWVLQFSYSITDTLTTEQRRKGWKISQTTTNACFTCSHCGHFWNSGRISLIFHYCLGRSKKATVILRPFGQQCRECDSDDLAKPKFREEKVESILNNIILKIKKNCYGEDIGNPTHVGSRRVLRTKPHESDLCEACAAGVCNKEQDVA